MKFGSAVAVVCAITAVSVASQRAQNPVRATAFPADRASAYGHIETESNVYPLAERATSIVVDDLAFASQRTLVETKRDPNDKSERPFTIAKMPFGEHDYSLSLNGGKDELVKTEVTKRAWLVSGKSISTFALSDKRIDGVRVSVALLGETHPTRMRIRYGAEVCEQTVDTQRRWIDVSCDKAVGSDTPLAVHFETEGDAPLVAWGDPKLVVGTRARLPYNVLWFVIDSLRADAIASLHDLAQKQPDPRVAYPPLEAALGSMPGLLPAMDRLAREGVRFRRAYSAATWTKPGTVAMLSGTLSSLAGIDPLPWVVDPKEAAALYEKPHFLLPQLLEGFGARTHAIVANPYIVGTHTPGVDLGFGHVGDVLKKEGGTGRIERDAVRFLSEHKTERFFAFVNFSGPHEPWEPSKEDLDRVPVPPEGPSDPLVRTYLAEAVRDDRSVGAILDALAKEGLADRTVVILTSDHGETFSSEHQGVSALDPIPMRFHHQTGAFEETTHVPLLMRLPNVLPKDLAIDRPVSTLDIVPTVVSLLGIPDPQGASRTGVSLLPIMRGSKTDRGRPVVSEGRGMAAILDGRMRLIVRYGGAREVTLAEGKRERIEHQLFDLESDPGERHDLAKERPEEVARLLEMLNQARAGAAPPAEGATEINESVDPELVKMLREWGYLR